MKDCYEVIGTSKEAMKRDMNNEPRTEEQIDNFLKMKYEDRLRKIEIMREAAEERGDQNRLKELEEEEQKVILAYQKISSGALREEYQSEIERKKDKIIVPTYKRKSPYEVLDINKEDFRQCTDEEIDKIIEERRNNLITEYSAELDSISVRFFSERMKLEVKIQEVEEAYSLISTVEKRKNYDQQIQEQEEEKKEIIEAQKLQQKYSHADEFDPNLIKGVLNSDYETAIFQAKKVKREKEVSKEYSYENKENRQLRIKQTAKIKFQNRLGIGELHINEYEVRRVIDGEEKMDIIYTLLSKRLEDIDRKIDPEYYDRFVNELLAEETIEGSKYNEGFIGGIETDQDGKYYITLGHSKLSPMEKEQLAAVCIMKKRDRAIREREKGKEEIV